MILRPDPGPVKTNARRIWRFQNQALIMVHIATTPVIFFGPHESPVITGSSGSYHPISTVSFAS